MTVFGERVVISGNFTQNFNQLVLAFWGIKQNKEVERETSHYFMIRFRRKIFVYYSKISFNLRRGSKLT